MTSIESVSDEQGRCLVQAGPGMASKLSMGGAWTIAESARLDPGAGRAGTGWYQGDVSIDASKISSGWTAPGPGCCSAPAGRWKRRAMPRSSGFAIPELYQRAAGRTSKNTGAQERTAPLAHPARVFAAGSTASAAPPCMPAYPDHLQMLGYLGRVTVETGEAIAKPAAAKCASPPCSTRSRRPGSTPCRSWACWPS